MRTDVDRSNDLVNAGEKIMMATVREHKNMAVTLTMG